MDSVCVWQPGTYAISWIDSEKINMQRTATIGRKTAFVHIHLLEEQVMVH